MRTIHILHLYSQSLDLYGDYKNLHVLSQRIRESGCKVLIHRQELFQELSFEGYDMVYIGHGKAENLAAVAKHFVAYSDMIHSAIEHGQLWLATGNARQLFGDYFTVTGGDRLPGIGLFDYHGVETGKVFVIDMIAHPVFDPGSVIYGFANRTAYLEGENRYPLFRVISGFGDGAACSGVEGTLYKNFFATWSMGPILARNPVIMREILRRLLKGDYIELDYTLEQRALELVLQEFRKELNNAEYRTK